MKVLVTGVTGFIGSHVARAFLSHGYAVRALVRPSANGHRKADVPAGAEPAWGDLRDRASLLDACRGCDALVHVAALYDLWSSEPSQFYAVNVAGTAALLDAADAAGIERVVYTSSVATIPPGGDEQAFAEPAAVHSHYKRSKILGERVARRHPNVVVVNPSTPIGPGDVRPTPTGKIVLDFIRGRMPAYVDTGLNLVDVGDVAEGHVLALERGQAGERYILGNQNLTLQAMLALLAKETGRQPPRLRLPLGIALAAGAVSEMVDGRLRGRPPTIPFEAVRMAGTPMFYDTSKARRTLNLPQTPIACALRESAQWFETNGYR